MITCANHTLFLMDARERLECLGCGLPPRPEPPKPVEPEPEAAPEGVSPVEDGAAAPVPEPPTAPERRGVGVKTPHSATRVRAKAARG